ncbi:hypothetical protein DZF91_06610 [Actinomadura logoneensis]|uniref:M23ase beta-sheet core domain-containing protein n=1 Tax=Actinomadura logoneensis TaxID=2293572 RepID=A0A372JR17_9ACTN|nr:M23 family metallopeptidase [Actinomadura logoneensis]RFU42447.1 hypothetical protein DZF91_06610 [Actinomadura logoneensis]
MSPSSAIAANPALIEENSAEAPSREGPSDRAAPSDPTRRSSTPEATGWRWPLGPPAPAVIRGFSPPTSPWLPGHRGVDLAASPGAPVYAAGPGRVSYAGALAGRGVVAITHGELRTTYLPVRPAVTVGRDVPAGARIGTVDPSAPAHCSQACLHWGLLRGTTYLDPLALVHPLVRLLPLWEPNPAPVPFDGLPSPTSPSTPSRPGAHSSPDLQAPPLARPERVRRTPAAASQLPKGDRPLRPALSGASAAVAGTLTCLVLALSLAFVRRGRGRPRARLPEGPPDQEPAPNVIDLAHERRLRRPTASHPPR